MKNFHLFFEFTETSDQIKAIEQIESDFVSGIPMDRLICGDVGFGKTEIAKRAAFIAISAGYQVKNDLSKVLLVNQHYDTLIEDLITLIIRFQNLKIRRF